MKNKIYPIMEFLGGCMYIEPIMVNGEYVHGPNWQVRVTREIRGRQKNYSNNDWDETNMRINEGIYPFVRFEEDVVNPSPEYLLYDFKAKKFVCERLANDPDASYYALIYDQKEIYRPDYNHFNWEHDRWLPGLVRCYCYKNDHFKLSGCSERFINIARIYSPNEYVDFISLRELVTMDSWPTLAYHSKNHVTFYFPRGEYFGSLHELGVIPFNRKIRVLGDGPEKTVFRHTDKEGNDLPATWSILTNTIYKDIKIMNHAFAQYHYYRNTENAILEFYNVHLEWTFDLPNTYMFVLYQTNLKFRFIGSKIIGKNLYQGIYINGPTDYKIEDSYFKADYWHAPISAYTCSGSIIRNCEIINGITGVFFGANKENVIERALIENCKFDGQTEEAIAFDCFGNNVELNPFISEHSIVDENEIKENGKTLLKLKIGKTRRIEGGHSNEYFIVDTQDDVDSDPDKNAQLVDNYTVNEIPMNRTNAIWLDENKEYLSKFYAVFNPNAGEGYTGTLAKIRRIEKSGEDFYLILERKMNKTGMEPTGRPTSSLVKDAKEYTVTISSGFFYCKILNNEVKNCQQTGVSMFNSFFGGIMTGNVIQNCRDVVLTGAFMLAKQVNNGAYGNIVANNVLIDVKGNTDHESGLKLCTDYSYSLGDKIAVNAYNNIVTDNTLVNTDFAVRNVSNCKIDGNNIQNGKMTISNAQTTTFGDESNKPKAALPGQTYYNQTTQQLEMWTGYEWIVK